MREYEETWAKKINTAVFINFVKSCIFIVLVCQSNKIVREVYSFFSYLFLLLYISLHIYKKCIFYRYALETKEGKINTREREELQDSVKSRINKQKLVIFCGCNLE